MKYSFWVDDGKKEFQIIAFSLEEAEQRRKKAVKLGFGVSKIKNKFL